ncbi:MAG: PTS sugar transporter subunit IIA [Deltaproteobacteria bacterium]|jgi:mannitol/fructose-specific phosphotransferase system IIA component|nr:PTS sugar transporter subunit IIA [Deltaproteobacteria bacterium]
MLSGKKPALLVRENIAAGLPGESREEAIRRVGRMLVDGGYVNGRYVDGMLARERSFTTAIGNLIAVPHGEIGYIKEIRHPGLAVCAYPDGIEWGGDEVLLVVGIAAAGDEHLEILGRIGDAFGDGSEVDAVVRSGDAERLFRILCPEGS